jgi:hypothetical protein
MNGMAIEQMSALDSLRSQVFSVILALCSLLLMAGCDFLNGARVIKKASAPATQAALTPKQKTNLFQNPVFLSLRANQSFDFALKNKGLFCAKTLNQWSYISQQGRAQVDSLSTENKIKYESEASAPELLICDETCLLEFCKGDWIKALEKSESFPLESDFKN